MKSTEWFRSRARDLYHEEGQIEIDVDARVSIGGDDGAYVQAWVWVQSEGKNLARHATPASGPRGARTP